MSWLLSLAIWDFVWDGYFGSGNSVCCWWGCFLLFFVVVFFLMFWGITLVGGKLFWFVGVGFVVVWCCVFPFMAWPYYWQISVGVMDAIA